MLVAVALLAMALAAAAAPRSGLALVAGIACAVVSIFGLLSFESTVHRDHLDRHQTPRLLSDSYVPVPGWVRRARSRRAGGEEQ